MAKFDAGMLKAAMAAVDATMAMEKKGFVPMPQGDPAAGGAPVDPAAAGGVPMDPAAAGMPMDPAAAGMPMDPAAAGGAPMDPAAAGMPMAPMPTPPDPAAGGMPMPGADGMVTMPVSQLIELLNTLGIAGKKGGGVGGGGSKPAGGSGASGGTDAMASQLNAIHQAMTNAGMIAPQAPAQPQA